MKAIRNRPIFLILILFAFIKPDYCFSLPLSGLEKTIRGKYDACTVFTWLQYTKLLDKLSQGKFEVLPLNEMRSRFDDTKVIVGLRHDIDFNPFKALEMAKIEEIYGIRSTFYFLATAEYYGHFNKNTLIRSPEMGKLLKEICKTGAEIGIHNDLLSIIIDHKLNPYLFNRDELEYYKSLKIPIFGTASHGSPLSKKTIPNYQVFSDFATSNVVEFNGTKYPIWQHSLKDYGFQYEAYHIPYTLYLTDTGGMWNDWEGFNGILKKLESSKPGDRIQILVHPDWWGRSLK
jgi:hypothetical protein